MQEQEREGGWKKGEMEGRKEELVVCLGIWLSGVGVEGELWWRRKKKKKRQAGMEEGEREEEEEWKASLKEGRVDVGGELEFNRTPMALPLFLSFFFS